MLGILRTSIVAEFGLELINIYKVKQSGLTFGLRCSYTWLFNFATKIVVNVFFNFQLSK